jgi:hypothetical protein
MTEITKDKITVEKYFAGLFTSESRLFTDNSKWLILSSILKIINKTNSTPILFPGAPFANIQIPGNNAFSCQIRFDGFSYSDGVEIPFGKFCEDVKSIGEIYKQELKDVFLKKIGLVISFRLDVDKPTEYLKNFLKLNTQDRITQSDFHINYKKEEQGILYNFNISLLADDNSKIVRGSFDVNSADPMKGAEIMVLDQVKSIYEYAYSYFYDENKFIKFLNNR